MSARQKPAAEKVCTYETSPDVMHRRAGAFASAVDGSPHCQFCSKPRPTHEQRGLVLDEGAAS
jgi:hypothetical protein